MDLEHRPVLVRLVQLRNPWGKLGWRGDWSEGSALWSAPLRRRLQPHGAGEGTRVGAPVGARLQPQAARHSSAATAPSQPTVAQRSPGLSPTQAQSREGLPSTYERLVEEVAVAVEGPRAAQRTGEGEDRCRGPGATQ